MPQSFGLLLATMEPAPADELEFHEWYDVEHVPERKALPGFLTAARFVCVDGWPRYVAIYDLATLSVLASEAYHAISGDNASAWSKRVISRVRGRFTAAAEQIHPGNGVTGGKGTCSRLAMLRFRNLPADLAASIYGAVSAAFDGQPGVLQLRLFASDRGDFVDHIALVEINGPAPTMNALRLGGAIAYLDLFNTYAPYWRAEARVIPKPPGQ